MLYFKQITGAAPGSKILVPHPNNPGVSLQVVVPPGAQPGSTLLVPVPPVKQPAPVGVPFSSQQPVIPQQNRPIPPAGHQQIIPTMQHQQQNQQAFVSCL